MPVLGCDIYNYCITAEIGALFSLLLLEIPGRLRVRCKFLWQRPLILFYNVTPFFSVGRDNYFRQIQSLRILIEKKHNLESFNQSEH